jgi:hypothetical protein
MMKRRDTGLVFLILALVFVIVGLTTDQGPVVVWIVVAAALAIVGATQLSSGRRP